MATAIIVAAGCGLRMGGEKPKQYLHLAQQPILWHTVVAMQACKQIDGLVLVVPQDDAQCCRDILSGALNSSVSLRFVAGGPQRQDSVYNGLRAVEDTSAPVLIHDGVRPFVTPNQIESCLVAAQKYGAAMLATAVIDTVKETDSKGLIRKTIPRNNLWLAQTPQAFRYEVILAAHELAKTKGWVATDDAALLEKAGIPVRIVRGSRFNIKITTPEDMRLAEAIFLSRSGGDVTIGGPAGDA